MWRSGLYSNPGRCLRDISTSFKPFDLGSKVSVNYVGNTANYEQL